MALLLYLVATATVMACGGGAAQELNLDMEYWMTELPPRLRDEPIIYLAIPGSHNSMSYGITRSSELAPDAPPALSRLFPLFRGTIVRWTRTQAADATHQLVLGIRYFDLRVATKEGSDRFFFTHGMYADEVSGALTQIKEFLDSHPHEAVILDFQHFYKMDGHDHGRLIAALVNMFGARICPRRIDLDSITLNTMHRAHQQVIIVYRHPAVYMSARLWQPEQMPTPWPRQDSVRGLLNFLAGLRRHPGTGFVHQAVLTPTTSFIILRWVSNLREQCAVPVQEKVLPLLRDLSPGAPPRHRDHAAAPVNVAIADFIEMNRAEFSKIIISLNYKLLSSNMFQSIVQVAPVDY